MTRYFKTNFYQLNCFFRNFIAKKIYVKKLNIRTLFLIKMLKQNYKKLNNKINGNYINFLITYVVKICFSKINTFLQITNTFGTLYFSCSAGNLFYKGKNKKARTPVLQDIIRFLVKKLYILKNKAIILHLKKTGFKKVWIIKKLSKKIIIKNIVGLNPYAYNGCRKKKIRRKKLK